MKNFKDILIIILILLLFGGGYYLINMVNGLDSELSQTIKLNEALKDSVEYFETKEGEWGAEKRTLQGEIDDLLEENNDLNEDQKALLNTVKRLNKNFKKEREIFVAARIRYETLIDSLDNVIANATDVDTVNNIVSFAQTDTAAHFIYDLDVLGVRPYPETTHPEIQFKTIDFPNEQTISFNWDKNKRKDYPISFSVINTNKYFKVENIESYAIPELQKDKIDPTGWQRVWRWIKINGKYVLVGAAGFTIGAAVSN